MDLYNYNDLAAFGGAGNVADVLKAMEAGLQTGMQYDNQINNGGLEDKDKDKNKKDKK